MLSTMSIVMSTAELKSLLEKRRREKVDQDERGQLLKGIRELDAYASVSSSSASSESGNMDPIVVNLLEEREEVIVPVQKKSTKCTLSHRPRVQKSNILDTGAAFVRWKVSHSLPHTLSHTHSLFLTHSHSLTHSDSRELSAWREFAHLCYLLQPTSASVERAFSMLKYIYTDQQSFSMVDLIKTTLMLRYNKD